MKARIAKVRVISGASASALQSAVEAFLAESAEREIVEVHPLGADYAVLILYTE